MSNVLQQIFDHHSGRLIHKLSHYFDIYERYFSKYVDKEVVILEIGISHGGSLQMWKKYFGNKVKIYAVDINPDCKRLEEENVTVFIGSQEDKVFLADLIKKIPPPDIIIDDGGHTMRQQIVSFEMLYGSLKDGGVYLCEDTCTSYWYEYGGGLRRKGTFVEYSKKLIDYLYAWQFTSKKVKVNEFTTHTNAIHFYDSVVVFEKLQRTQPQDLQRGEKAINHDEDPQAGKRSIWHQLRKKYYALRS